MSSLSAIARKVRLGEPLPLHWDLLLRAATPATRIAMAYRLRRPPVSLPVPVIAFGNITAGGTGKTPAVIARVREELDEGRRVAVVTRGYGSERVAEPFAVEDSMTRADVARLVGDEPALIRMRAPGCAIIKSADRVAGARMALERFSCDCVVLDDAFQNVALGRDENICLIDASNPFGNGHLIPRGILREPLTALQRATRIVLTRCDQAEDLPGLRNTLREVVPDIPVRETIHAPGRFWKVRSGETVATPGTGPVTAVCGVGNPEAFLRTLKSLHVDVAQVRAYGDHAAIPPDALEGPHPIVTTEKDAMRMVDPPDSVLALEVVLEDWVEA